MNSSIVASVAFLKIQDFARRPPSEQARLRAQLEAVVAVVSAEVPPASVISTALDATLSVDEPGTSAPGRLVNGSFADRPEVYQRVLVDRNERWVPKIEALIEGGVPTLVIVGTGHLVGRDSVVAMLQAKGHFVTQQ